MKSQFALALIIAAAADSLQKLKDIKESLSAKQEVSDELKRQRLDVCESCPVYYPRLRTCGSALKRSTPETRGCGCWMPLKAGLKVNCWLFDFHRGQTIAGWDRSLNSFPDVYDAQQS